VKDTISLKFGCMYLHFIMITMCNKHRPLSCLSHLYKCQSFHIFLVRLTFLRRTSISTLLWECEMRAFDINVVSTSGYILQQKAIPLQAWTGPEGLQEVEAPRFQDNRHMKVVRLSALRPGCFYPPPPENISGTYFC
jgi:hypothetical protein